MIVRSWYATMAAIIGYLYCLNIINLTIWSRTRYTYWNAIILLIHCTSHGIILELFTFLFQSNRWNMHAINIYIKRIYLSAVRDYSCLMNKRNEYVMMLIFRLSRMLLLYQQICAFIAWLHSEVFILYYFDWQRMTTAELLELKCRVAHERFSQLKTKRDDDHHPRPTLK